MLFEIEHEMIVPAAINQQAGVALGEAPDIAPVIGRSMVGEQGFLELLGLDFSQSPGFGRGQEFVARQGPACRRVASPKTQGELVNNYRVVRCSRCAPIARVCRCHCVYL